MANKITNSVRHAFEEMLKSPSGYAKFKRIMAATKRPESYLAYFKEAMDRCYGRATQTVEMDVNDVTDRPTKLELDAALRSINSHSEGKELEKK